MIQMKMSPEVLTVPENIPRTQEEEPEKMSSVAVTKKSTEYCFKKEKAQPGGGWGGRSQSRSKCFLLN